MIHCNLINTSQRGLGCLLNPSAVCSSNGVPQGLTPREVKRGLGKEKPQATDTSFCLFLCSEAFSPCTPPSFSPFGTKRPPC